MNSKQRRTKLRASRPDAAAAMESVLLGEPSVTLASLSDLLKQVYKNREVDKLFVKPKTFAQLTKALSFAGDSKP